LPQYSLNMVLPHGVHLDNKRSSMNYRVLQFRVVIIDCADYALQTICDVRNLIFPLPHELASYRASYPQFFASTLRSCATPASNSWNSFPRTWSSASSAGGRNRVVDGSFTAVPLANYEASPATALQAFPRPAAGSG
jgi:hypothetical protein